MTMVTMSIAIIRGAVIPDTKGKNYVLWTRSRLGWLAWWRMVYAGLFLFHSHRHCRMAAISSSAEPGRHSLKLSKMLRWNSGELFPVSPLRGNPEAQLPELQQGFRAELVALPFLQ